MVTYEEKFFYSDIGIRYINTAKKLKLVRDKWRANIEMSLLNSWNKNSLYRYINKILSSPAKQIFILYYYFHNHDIVIHT